MHVYLCAECGEKFQTEEFENRCPFCRCKVLIHLEGEKRRANSCSGCGGGCSCGGCRR
jgi:DNA-directed RNA polymerase subunit RPC12/RpoP